MCVPTTYCSSPLNDVCPHKRIYIYKVGFRLSVCVYTFYIFNQKIIYSNFNFDFMITLSIIDRFKEHAIEASNNQSEVGKPPAGARISGGP